MFRLVVLCAFLVAVAAEPGVFFSAPLTYSTVLAPATTTITKSASSVIHPSPVVYSAPLAYSHFIKKRSAQYIPYYSYSPNTFVGAALATPLVSTQFVRSPAILPVASTLPYAHLIKKRSAPLLIAPTTYTTPLLQTTYAANTPYFSSAPLYNIPLTYSSPYAHYIKK